MPTYPAASDDDDEPILLVDDNPIILALLGASIRHRSLTACGVTEARELLQTARFRTVVSDLNLRDGDGIAVLDAAREHQPWARRLLLSAALDKRATEALDSGLATALIPKPWTIRELRFLLP